MIDERTAQLDERGKLIAALEVKNLELERFNHALAHDLKNPLVTIRTFLGLLQKHLHDSDGTERLTRDLHHIEAAARHLERMFEDLTRLADVAPPPVGADVVELSEIAREAVALVGAEARRAGIVVTVAADLPGAFGDRGRLLELFHHLLDNAIKFTDSVDQPLVEVGWRRDADGKVVYVRDNGIGIERPYQTKVFGLFERLEPSIQGTGIGLTLAKRIVEAHGGRIWVESQGRGRGSTFCLTLPGPEEPGG